VKSPFERTELLIQEPNIKGFTDRHVGIFGVGGVGSIAAEALVRAGLKEITLIDYDRICITNINRQIQATYETIGEIKVEALKKRLLSINPDCIVHAIPERLDESSIDELVNEAYDYIIDAIDTISAKIMLVKAANALKIPMISSMGAGNKLNPMDFKVSDLSKTRICPLAKIMRKELRRQGIYHLKVVYSEEEPLDVPKISSDPDYPRKKIPGSISFVPPTMGLIIASEVFKDLWKGVQHETIWRSGKCDEWKG